MARVASLVTLALLAVPALAQTQPTTAPAEPGAFRDALRKARGGDLVRTPFATLADVPAVPLVITPAEGQPQFLFSDAPEYFRAGDGIAMRERVEQGAVRLYLYHVPTPAAGEKVISASIENLSADEPMVVAVRHRALPRPGGDYHAIAKAAMPALLEPGDPAKPPRSFMIEPGAVVPLDAELDALRVTTDQLVHLVLDFDVDHPALVTVHQRGPADPIDVVRTLPVMMPYGKGQAESGAGRGLFATTRFDVRPAGGEPYDPRQGARQILVADGKADPWVTGRDSLSDRVPPAPGVIKGNYGAVYTMRLPMRSTAGPRRVAVLMCSDRTGQYCGAAAAVVRLDGRPVSLPRNEVRFRTLPQAVVVGVIDLPADGAVREVELAYTPPGASCLPTPILLVPVD